MKPFSSLSALAALLSCFVLASPSTAQVSAFGALDTDDNGIITRTEFAEAAVDSSLFASLDSDSDGRLGTDEFYSGLYSRWDRDGNGELSVSEWDRGVDAVFGEGDIALEVAQWDDNGDGIISRPEFIEALAETQLFAGIDASDDELLGEEEFYDGLYGVADRNQDAELDEEEAALFDFDFSLFGDDD